MTRADLEKQLDTCRSLTIRQWACALLLGEAPEYLTIQSPKWVRYIEDGRLEIDTNLAENAIRPFARGKRAWLYADTASGEKVSAAFFSLIETAKANALEPYTICAGCLSACCMQNCPRLRGAVTLSSIRQLLSASSLLRCYLRRTEHR